MKNGRLAGSAHWQTHFDRVTVDSHRHRRLRRPPGSTSAESAYWPVTIKARIRNNFGVVASKSQNAAKQTGGYQPERIQSC